MREYGSFVIGSYRTFLQLVYSGVGHFFSLWGGNCERRKGRERKRKEGRERGEKEERDSLSFAARGRVRRTQCEPQILIFGRCGKPRISLKTTPKINLMQHSTTTIKFGHVPQILTVLGEYSSQNDHGQHSRISCRSSSTLAQYIEKPLCHIRDRRRPRM